MLTVYSKQQWADCSHSTVIRRSLLQDKNWWGSVTHHFPSVCWVFLLWFLITVMSDGLLWAVKWAPPLYSHSCLAVIKRGIQCMGLCFQKKHIFLWKQILSVNQLWWLWLWVWLWLWHATYVMHSWRFFSLGAANFITQEQICALWGPSGLMVLFCFTENLRK